MMLIIVVQEMDARKMAFKDSAFDYVFDKATVDSLIVSYIFPTLNYRVEIEWIWQEKYLKKLSES